MLKCDAVKARRSICQQIWWTQQWPQDWKRSVFIPTLKKGNVKECSNYRTIVLISHASKIMLKILQARLQQYWSIFTENCQMFKLDLEKAEEPEIKLPISAGSSGRRQWHPTPVLLPGKSHGWRSLVGCSPWGHWGSDTTWVTSLSLFTFHFHALEKEMATHSNVFAWRIPGMGEPGGLPSMGSHRVGHKWSDLAAVAY